MASKKTRSREAKKNKKKTTSELPCGKPYCEGGVFCPENCFVIHLTHPRVIESREDLREYGIDATWPQFQTEEGKKKIHSIKMTMSTAFGLQEAGVDASSGLMTSIATAVDLFMAKKG